MSIDEIARQSLLFDSYGALLSQRQRQVMELYTEENLSLQEIAEELGISRQGVHDALRSARKSLEGYEEKLGLVERYLKTETVTKEVNGEIRDMIGLLESAGRIRGETVEAVSPAKAGTKASAAAPTEPTPPTTAAPTEPTAPTTAASTRSAAATTAASTRPTASTTTALTEPTALTTAALLAGLRRIQSIIDQLEE